MQNVSGTIDIPDTLVLKHPSSPQEDSDIQKTANPLVPPHNNSESKDSLFSKRKSNFGKEEFSTTIEINDVKNRYFITKGTTQIKIRQETGAE